MNNGNISVKILFGTVLLVLSSIILTTRALGQEDCIVHFPLKNASDSLAVDKLSGWVQGDSNNQKVRIQVYYDAGIPSGLGITPEKWKEDIRLNLLKFDTALWNVCASDHLGNLSFKIDTSPVVLPADLNAAFNSTHLPGGQLHSVWNAEYDCFIPHIIVVIPPLGSTGARGVGVVLTEPFAAVQTAVSVIQPSQIKIQNETGAHELGHNFGGFHPSDTLYAPDPSYLGYGITPTGKRSLMKSPTTFETILTEGSLDQTCLTALYNGTTNLGAHWMGSFLAYTSSRPDFSLEATASASVVVADSQNVILNAQTNRAKVNYHWKRNGLDISDTKEWSYSPTAVDTGLITFVLVANNCGGEELTDTLHIMVLPKPLNPMATASNEVEMPAPKIFPNPVATLLLCDRTVNIVVLDLYGRQVLSVAQQSFADMSSIPPGLYHVKLTSGYKIYHEMVIKI